MNVTIYFTGSYPYGNAASNRVHHIAKGLVDNNLNVKLIITNPTENDKNSLNYSTIDNYEGVNYSYISKSTFRHKNLLFRKIIDLNSYVQTYYNILFSTKKPDFIIIIGGAFFDFRLFIPFFVKMIHAKTILEINEYPYVNNAENVFSSFKKFIFYKIFLPSIDGFIVISDALLALLKNNKINESKIIKVPILFEEITKESEQNINIKKPFILHAGSISSEEKDGMLGCIKAFKIARDKLNIDLKYIVATNFKNALDIIVINNFIARNNIENDVIFLENLSKHELCSYYKNASLAIINKANSKQNIYGFATKISEYVANKIPLIVTPVGEINSFFKNDFNAIFTPINDEEQLSDKIVLLLKNVDNAKQIADNAYFLSKTVFNPKMQGERLCCFFEKINKK